MPVAIPANQHLTKQQTTNRSLRKSATKCYSLKFLLFENGCRLYLLECLLKLSVVLLLFFFFFFKRTVHYWLDHTLQNKGRKVCSCCMKIGQRTKRRPIDRQEAETRDRDQKLVSHPLEPKGNFSTFMFCLKIVVILGGDRDASEESGDVWSRSRRHWLCGDIPIHSIHCDGHVSISALIFSVSRF